MLEKRVGKPAISRKSVLWQTLFVIAMLLVMRYLWVRSRPETLGIFEIPTENALISGDRIYRVTPYSAQSKGPGIETMSVYDGTRRDLVAKETSADFFSLPRISQAGGKLYYALVTVEAPPKPKNTFASGVVSSSQGEASSSKRQPRVFLGTFLHAPQTAPGTVVKREYVPNFGISSPAGLSVRIRQVALQGGVPQDAAKFRVSDCCLVGSNAFWVRPGAYEEFTVSRQGSYWTESTAHCDVMETSLTDGATRCIRSGVPRNIDLHPEAEGVSWVEPALFPNPSTLFYARADGSVCSLGRFVKEVAGYSWPSLESRIVEIGERIYWRDLLSVSSGPGVKVNWHLMSARLDGTDRKEVCARWHDMPIEDLLIHSYQGTLYACVLGASETTRGRSDHVCALCRVYPERADPLEQISAIPEGMSPRTFSGGALYLDRQEKRRSFLANLLNDDAGVAYKKVVYRMPLRR